MPPKPNNVDGITKQAVPAPPHSVSLNAEITKEKQDQAHEQAKNNVKASNVDHVPIVTILITLIFMVLLIGLAYYAYTKSK